MTHDFIAAHRLLTYFAGAGVFALSGYGLARLFPGNHLSALGSWFIALLYLAFGLASVRSLSPLGPALALVALAAGFAWMARYYVKHRRE